MISFKKIVIVGAALLAAPLLLAPASAEKLAQPIIEKAEGDLDTCALGEVIGLKKQGDGFLFVRSGPATTHKKLDELHNGDRVWVFQQVGDWFGVLYGVENVECSPIQKDKVLKKEGRKGWVHKNWVQIIAG